MEHSYSLALILMSMVVIKVQGYYYSDLNGTTTSSVLSNNRINKSNKIYHNELIERTRHKYHSEKQFEQVFQHYRNDRREPRFVSFQTKDDNIEVEIDFAIPFLTIPVKRSLSGAMGTLQNVISGIPMANINIGAVLLTGVVIIGGAMIGGIGRLLNGGSFLEVSGGLPFFKNSNKKQKQDDFNENGSQWWYILEEIDRALLKYDIDTTACTQRTICWYVKESIANVDEKRASNFDHLINSLSSSEWVQQMLSNTAWNNAISAAKQNQNCELAFSTCKISPTNLESFANKIRQYTKRK